MNSDSIAGRTDDATASLNVLVVEDDDDARENLRDILELEDHRVSMRTTFAEAFSIGQLAAFDVIILDRKLPDGMVEEQLPQFRELAPSTDLIVVTGYADTQASIAALREGVTDYIIKPIDPKSLLVTLQHIGKRRAIERQLQTEHQFAEMIMQTSEAIILVLDTHGRITRFNEYLADLTGRTLEEVEDRDWFDTFIPERDRETLRQFFRQAINNLSSRGNLNPILTKSGDEREVRWSNSLIKDRVGKVTGVLSVGLDVTDLIGAQEKARRSDRLATIGQTMTGMAHESRNALQRIRNSVELLEDELDGNKEALRYVEKISRASNDLRDLLEEVRAYAAPIKLDLEKASLQTIWRRAWESLEHQHKEAVLVEASGDEAAPTAIVDARRLEQVFRNLFENSFDACGAGVEVCIGYKSSDEDIGIRIRDNGPGLPEEIRAQVFDAFFYDEAHRYGARNGNCASHHRSAPRHGRGGGHSIRNRVPDSTTGIAAPVRCRCLRANPRC
jgi:PAS domain S-box-containing protein